jgi:hypothetical protein
MNTGTRRFFIAHMLAYVIAMPWGIAAVPMIFMWKEEELLAMSVEEAAVRYVVKLTLVPLTVAFILPHLFSIPWILSAKKATHQGWLLFAGSSALIVATGLGLSVVAWVRFLGA